MFFMIGHLTVDKLTLSDAERFHTICNQSFITRWMDDWKMTEEEVTGVIKRFIDGYAVSDPAQVPFALAVRLDGLLVGICGFGPKEELGDEVEICYFMDEKYSGRGCMSEVLPRAIEYYFDMTSRSALFALVEEENISSLKLLLKNGFAFVKKCESDGRKKAIYCRIRNMLSQDVLAEEEHFDLSNKS